MSEPVFDQAASDFERTRLSFEAQLGGVETQLDEFYSRAASSHSSFEMHLVTKVTADEVLTCTTTRLDELALERADMLRLKMAHGEVLAEEERRNGRRVDDLNAELVELELAIKGYQRGYQRRSHREYEETDREGPSRSERNPSLDSATDEGSSSSEQKPSLDSAPGEGSSSSEEKPSLDSATSRSDRLPSPDSALSSNAQVHKSPEDSNILTSTVAAAELSPAAASPSPSTSLLPHAKRWDVFVSFTNLDLPGVAVSLLQQFMNQGLHVFNQKRDFAGAEVTVEVMQEHVRASRVLIVLITPNFFYSAPCRAEVEAAVASGVPVIPVHSGEDHTYKHTLDWIKKEHDLVIGPAVRACFRKNENLIDINNVRKPSRFLALECRSRLIYPPYACRLRTWNSVREICLRKLYGASLDQHEVCVRNRKHLFCSIRVSPECLQWSLVQVSRVIQRPHTTTVFRSAPSELTPELRIRRWSARERSLTRKQERTETRYTFECIPRRAASIAIRLCTLYHYTLSFTVDYTVNRDFVFHKTLHTVYQACSDRVHILMPARGHSNDILYQMRVQAA